MNLYNIEQELEELFTTLEENEGEITEDQYNQLCIKQEELKSKLESYYHAVRAWESDAECCKNEKKRINDVQNKFKNRIDRLKAAIIDAITRFGDCNKSGTKYIELPTMRMSIRGSVGVEINQDRTNLFIGYFVHYVQELYSQGVIYTGDDVDMQGILDVINAECIAEYGDDFNKFTFDDMRAIKVEVSTTLSPMEMFVKHPHILHEIGQHPIITHTNDATSKSECKDLINGLDAIGEKDKYITVANLVANSSLIMK